MISGATNGSALREDAKPWTKLIWSNNECVKYMELTMFPAEYKEVATKRYICNEIPLIKPIFTTVKIKARFTFNPKCLACFPGTSKMKQLKYLLESLAGSSEVTWRGRFGYIRRQIT